MGEVYRDSSKNEVRDSSKNEVRDSSKNEVRDSSKNEVRDSSKNEVRDSSKNEVEDSVERTSRFSEPYTLTRNASFNKYKFRQALKKVLQEDDKKISIEDLIKMIDEGVFDSLDEFEDNLDRFTIKRR